MSLGLVRDALNSKPFQFADMTEAANDIIPYKPGQVGSLGLFKGESLFTDVAYISERSGKLSLVATSQRGGPSQQITPPKSKLIPVQTYRLSEEDQINASELFKASGFHQIASQENIATIRNQRLSMMADNMDLTMEHLRLNCLKGVTLDADGTTPLTDQFATFGVTQEPEVAFDLGTSTKGLLAKKQAAIKRTIYNYLETDAARVDHIHVLCSPTFFDDLLQNVDIVTWGSLVPNTDFLQRSRVFGTMTWQGFVFEEYRLGTIASGAGGSWIDADKCIIFPVGPNIYPEFYSPGEFFGALDGTPGIPRYARAAADQQWDEYIKLKLQSYPLPMCMRPKVLMKGKKGA